MGRRIRRDAVHADGVQEQRVDFDGDGRRDVVDSVADILASTANKFKKDGWKTGETWGYEVEVPRDFNFALADRSKNMTIAQWEKLGIRRAGGKPFPSRPTRPSCWCRAAPTDRAS